MGLVVGFFAGYVVASAAPWPFVAALLGGIVTVVGLVAVAWLLTRRAAIARGEA